MRKEKIKNSIIKTIDDYSSCIADDFKHNQNNNSERRPKGYVKIYECSKDVDVDNLDNDNLLGTYNVEEPKVKKNNLILYSGREWLGSSIFGLENSNITPGSSDKIYWLGLGSGGAPTGDPFNPTNPEQLDTELNEPVMINVNDSAYGDYRTTPDVGYYKKLLSNTEFEQDDLNENKYLISKTTIVITSSDANDFIINEAGLFIASSNTPGFTGDFTIFSKVTFPSIAKTATRQLVFVWYIYS